MQSQLVLEKIRKNTSSLTLLEPNYRYEKLKKTDNQKRYKDFYKVGTVSTELGTYNLYLEMNQDWVDEYQKRSY